MPDPSARVDLADEPGNEKRPLGGGRSRGGYVSAYGYGATST
jgi:hypothetical protein